ncbi:unnamed protein product [Adineta steineri]|uniref:Uncharacterized protein n=1 Tax=Adineta steineri TaxID=433720 RepID=A0A819Q5K9_9BILA|nr:unnamed protein product [Adineta steineri]
MYRLVVLQILICIFLKQNNADTNSDINSFDASAYALEHRCVWHDCNVPGYPSKHLGYSVDCCTLQAPLNYNQPAKTINISMSRLRPLKPPKENNTIFVLMGGPGGSGWALFYGVSQMFPSGAGATIILPDHRGTGLSNLLSCNDNGSQIINVDCIKYLTTKYGVKGLNQFSVTSAAHDLSVQIQSYKADYPGRVAVHAVSYGTYWLNRFLVIYPNIVQSAVMDGVMNPVLNSDSHAALGGSAVAFEFLSYCRLQPACVKAFPLDKPPYIMLLNILMELESNEQKCINNHLTEYNITAGSLRHLFFNLIGPAEHYLDRTIIPAVIYRLYRCDKDDVEILKFFFRTVAPDLAQSGGEPKEPGFINSVVLHFNIVESETYLAKDQDEVDINTVLGWQASTIMASKDPTKYVKIRSKWPKYPLDEYHFKIASYTPLLMLSGQLDPSTLYDEAVHLASLTRKTRTFYGIPLAGHVSANIMQAGYDCPLHLIASWVFPDLFPSEWNDTNCIHKMPKTIDFVGETEPVRQISMKYLNINEPFGKIQKKYSYTTIIIIALGLIVGGWLIIRKYCCNCGHTRKVNAKQS